VKSIEGWLPNDLQDHSSDIVHANAEIFKTESSEIMKIASPSVSLLALQNAILFAKDIAFVLFCNRFLCRISF